MSKWKRRFSTMSEDGWVDGGEANRRKRVRPESAPSFKNESEPVTSEQGQRLWEGAPRPS